MRSHPVFFALFVATTLPACQKLEQKAEAKAEATVERKITEHTLSGMGGSVTTNGLCPDWPKSIPEYPHAVSTVCQGMDAAKVEASPGFQAYMATQPATKRTGSDDDDFAAYMLTFETTDSTDAVDAFYAKHLSAPADVAAAPSLFPFKPLVAREATAADPVTLVLRLQDFTPPSGRNAITLLVESMKK